MSFCHSRSNMKQLFITGWLSLFSGLGAFADTAPIFINNTPTTSPPDETPAIDATAWVNHALFDITAVNGSGIPLPYESQNTLFFTNTAPMVGNPGFRFFYNAGPSRLWMDPWTNSSSISPDNALIFSNAFGLFSASLGIFFGLNSKASVLMVKSTNIASTGSGTLRSGAQGIIHLEGKKINLKRNGL